MGFEASLHTPQLSEQLSLNEVDLLDADGCDPEFRHMLDEIAPSESGGRSITANSSQQAPRTDVDASAELSDREKFVRALSRDSAERAPWGENRESGRVMRRRQVRRLGYQAHHITSLHF